MAFLKKFFEKRKLRRHQRSLIAKLIPVALEVMGKGERFALPDNVFYSSDDISEFVSRLCFAAGIPIRASISDGLLFVYPDDGEDGIGITIAGVER